MDRIDTVLIQGREWPFQHQNKIYIIIIYYSNIVLVLVLVLVLRGNQNKNKTKRRSLQYWLIKYRHNSARVLYFPVQKKWAPLWFIGHFLHVRFHIYLSCHSLCPLQTGYVISLKILGVLRTTWASIGFHITHFSLLITQYSFSFSFSFSYLIFYSLFFS